MTNVTEFAYNSAVAAVETALSSFRNSATEDSACALDDAIFHLGGLRCDAARTARKIDADNLVRNACDSLKYAGF